jgi:trk system potassium uptake protein TrkA
MRIIILGAGGVGFHLAKSLSQEGHDITIIDNNPAQIARVNEFLDVMAVLGEGTGITNLQKEGLENADMLLAVTSADEVNLLACMAAKKFGVPTKIARVKNEEYSRESFILFPEEMGVDFIINPELEAANEIVQMVQYPYAFDMVEFENGKIILVGLTIDEDSPVLGQTLSSVVPRYEELTFLAVAINRGGQTIIPSGEDIVQKGDKFYVIVKQEMLNTVFLLASSKVHTARNVMILGGGKIGRFVAERLAKLKHINVKLIEANKEKSRLIAQKLKDTMVVYGDGTDFDLLAQEDITAMDMFIAVTDDDETNIVSSLLARHLKVPRTVTLISRGEYMPIVKTIGLDIAINARIITSDNILKYIRRGAILSLNTLRGIDAETIEFEVSSACKAVGKKLREVEFPSGVIVGALMHNGEVIVPVGDTIIHTGDRAIVFSVPDSVKEAEKMFAQ